MNYFGFVPISFKKYEPNEWVLGDLIGRGTYGSVHKIHKFFTCVAQKTYNCGIEADVIREIASYAILTYIHATTLNVYGISLSDSKCYISFELATTNLFKFSKYLKSEERIEIFDIVIDGVLKSLSEIHACGIIHCDIKPENILIWHDNLVIEKIAVVDFGLASSTPYIDNIYTLPYRPPEIFKGKRASKASDMWAMGITLVDFLTGCSIIENRDNEKNKPIKFEMPFKNFDVLAQTNKEEYIMKMLNENPAKRPTLYKDDFSFPPKMIKDDPKIGFYINIIKKEILVPEYIYQHAIQIAQRYNATLGDEDGDVDEDRDGDVDKKQDKKEYEKIGVIVAASFLIATKWGDEIDVEYDEIDKICGVTGSLEREMDIIYALDGLVYISNN